MKQTYYCQSCNFTGDEHEFKTKLLSMMYRPKYDNIQAFKKVECPKCKNIVTIIFETLDGSLQR